MTLEVRQNENLIIEIEILPYYVLIKMETVLNGNLLLSILIHDVARKDLETMILDRLPMKSGILSTTTVCGTAFDNRSI